VREDSDRGSARPQFVERSHTRAEVPRPTKGLDESNPTRHDGRTSGVPSISIAMSR
jgi:hypothetical protein